MTTSTLSEELSKYEGKKLTDAQLEQYRRNHYDGICQYECPECRGIGYVSIPTDKGSRVELCSKVDKWSLPGTESRYGITKGEFKNLDWKDIIDINGAKEAAVRTFKVMTRGFGWVYLHGTYGIGKTHIMKVATAVALRNGYEACYVRMAEILDHLRDGFNTKTGISETERLLWWSKLPILCIDEFDRIRESEYSDERRFVLMDRRYESAIREETITIIASNDPPEKQSGYLKDRIVDGRFEVIKIDGQSLRPGMRLKK